MSTLTSLKTILSILLFIPFALFAQIDLELNMTGNPLVPEAFKNFTFVITATNTGSATATGVEVDIPLPPGFIYQGGNAYSASQGDYDFFLIRKWNLGTLAPGASATFNLNLYSLQSTQLFAYAEVSAANQSDLDSTPANGGCPGPDPSGCTINEDDEAIVILSNSGNCSITASVIGTTCNNPGGTPNPLDDLWSIALQVDETDAPSGGWIAYNQGIEVGTGNYGQIQNITGLSINDGPVELTLFDQQNNGCFTTFTVTPPAPCSNSNCSISASTSNPICSDSGTPNDPTDDGFQFFLFVNPTNPLSTKYRATISNANSLDVLEIDYGQDLLISKFIGDGLVTITVSDLTDPNCTTTITVNPTAPCSGTGGSGIDLELNLTSANTSPAIYTTNSYTLTISNNGTSAATGIEIDFPDNANMAYVSHTTSQGIFSNWVGNWNVGTLPAGASATLDIDLFSLSGDLIQLYAQVSAHNETDNDSSPGNGACCTSTEDDETVLNLNGNATPNCNLNVVVPILTCNNNDTPTIPGDDIYNFSITPTGSNLGSSFAISGGGLSLNGLPYGQTYTSPFLSISAGSFLLSILDASGNCTQEISIIPPVPCSDAGPSGGADLEIDLTASQSTVSSWEFLSMTLTVNNTGNLSATDIAIRFPVPEGVVLDGGNPYTASQGSYTEFFEIWELGDLPAGGAATITLNLFSLQETNPLVGYAEVMSMNETDNDSTPGNGSCCIANEDDEAVVALAPSSNAPANRLATTRNTNTPVIKKLFPNPVSNDLQIVLESAVAQEREIEIYNLHGQLVMVKQFQFFAGVNFITLPVRAFSEGMYMIHLPGNSRSLGINRFIVQRN